MFHFVLTELICIAPVLKPACSKMCMRMRMRNVHAMRRRKCKNAEMRIHISHTTCDNANMQKCEHANMPHATCHMPHATYHIFDISHITYHISHATCHMPHATYHVSHVTYHITHITYHISRITCHISRITYHVSNFTCHILHITELAHIPCLLSL
jgi:hypothetical protein